MTEPLRTPIRFFPDMGHYLWQTGDIVLPHELGLSEGLTRNIEEWYAFWRAHTTFDDAGWDSPESREWYRQESQRLITRIREERPDLDIIDESDYCL